MNDPSGNSIDFNPQYKNYYHPNKQNLDFIAYEAIEEMASSLESMM